MTPDPAAALNKNPLKKYAVQMLGPRNHWPSISDHMYACLIEQFCDAAEAAIKDDVCRETVLAWPNIER